MVNIGQTASAFRRLRISREYSCRVGLFIKNILVQQQDYFYMKCLASLLCFF